MYWMEEVQATRRSSTRMTCSLEALRTGFFVCFLGKPMVRMVRNDNRSKDLKSMVVIEQVDVKRRLQRDPDVLTAAFSLQSSTELSVYLIICCALLDDLHFSRLYFEGLFLFENVYVRKCVPYLSSRPQLLPEENESLRCTAVCGLTFKLDSVFPSSPVL